LVILNASGDRRVTLGSGAYGATTQRNWFVLPPAEEWFFRRWNLDYRPLPPEEDLTSRILAGAALPGERSLALFNPEPGANIFVPRELDGREGRIVFSAAHRDETEIIHWHLDGDFLGITQTFHQMEARPPAGQRTLTLVDSGGNTLTRHFTVLENVE
jgi:penicillin-binding protein 1C